MIDTPSGNDATARSPSAATLCSLFTQTAEEHRDVAALKWRTPAGWQAMTWGDYRARVSELTAALTMLGFRAGERALIQSRNRPEHVIADLGILHAGGVAVGVYNGLTAEQLAEIALDCAATAAFVDEPMLARLLSIRDRLPSLRWVVVLDGAAPVGVIGWDDLLKRGRAAISDPAGSLDRAAATIRPEDTATLIYTSGTTGKPKGVVLTHRAILWTLESVRWHAAPEERVISYLPLAHVAERTATHWAGLKFGWTTHFCADPQELPLVLREVRPTRLLGVPRVWEKLQAAILARVRTEADATKRAMLERAVGDGPSDDPRLGAVRRALLEGLGLDRCALAATGAAPAAIDTLQFFARLGLVVAEVWGMSELGGAGTTNPIERIKPGTVGVPCRGAEVRLAADGELLFRSGGMMSGYHGDAEGTREAIDADGWLHTGDLATVDPEGYITIVGRKKDLIITAGGKNIAPARIEKALERSALVSQAAVIGDRRPYLTALLTLSADGVQAWARARGLVGAAVTDFAGEPALREEIARAVAAANETLSRVEQIKRFEVLPQEWTPLTGEVTPTMKIRRAIITEKYQREIDRMYEAT